MKLNQKTADKLRRLAIEARYRANDYASVSNDDQWQKRAGRLDRAAELLSQAAAEISAALVGED